MLADYRAVHMFTQICLENKCDNIHYRMNGRFFSIISTRNKYSFVFIVPTHSMPCAHDITIVNYNLI